MIAVSETGNPAPPPEEGPPPVAAALDSILRILRRGLAVLALLYLASGITFVGAGDSALVLRLGKARPEVAPPGLLLAWPRPFDRVVLVPGRRVLELDLDEWKPLDPLPAAEEDPFPSAQLFPDTLSLEGLHPVTDGYSLTGDRNILRGSFTARYRVVDPHAYGLGQVDPDAAIRHILYRALTRCLADESVDGALFERRQDLATRTIDVAQSLAEGSSLGIAFEALEIRELTPPANVLVAFQKVIDAQILAQTLVNEAFDETAHLLPSAEARAHRIRSEADAAANARTLRAEAEAGAFAQVLAAAAEDLPGYRLRHLAETRSQIWSTLKDITVLPVGETPVRLLLPAAGAPFAAPGRQGSLHEDGYEEDRFSEDRFSGGRFREDRFSEDLFDEDLFDADPFQEEAETLTDNEDDYFEE